jgi:hypothetical protein
MSQWAFGAEILEQVLYLLEQFFVEFGLRYHLNEALLYLGFGEQDSPPRKIAFRTVDVPLQHTLF